MASSIVACSGVLGIEKAEHDEKLDQTGAGGKGAGGSDGTSGTSSTGGTATGPKTLCERYCDTVMANCTGDNPVYKSRAVCDEVCKVLPPGRPGDTDVDSIECRLHFAELVATLGEASVNCPAAGPGGDGICGANCEGFCTIALAACPDSPVSGVGCAKACSDLPDPGGYTSNIDSGDSVECRLYHASAATVDPATHCRHTGGVGACFPPKP
ncbi:MAG TPA: hypothetical protein VF395_03195 [Polyangiaceae bacterium]